MDVIGHPSYERKDTHSELQVRAHHEVLADLAMLVLVLAPRHQIKDRWEYKAQAVHCYRGYEFKNDIYVRNDTS